MRSITILGKVAGALWIGAICTFAGLVEPSAQSNVGSLTSLEAALPTSAFMNTPGPDRIMSEVILVDQVMFKKNNARLTRSNRALLKSLAEMLKQETEILLSVRGHTDAGERNIQALSLKRAEQVKKYLIKQGVPSSFLETKVVGAGQPMGMNASEKDQNRRVDFKFYRIIEFQEHMYFPNGSTAPENATPLDRVAERLKAHQFVKLRIAGHTDRDEGKTRTERDKLSLERATAIRRALIARGVDPKRLSIVGMGDRSNGDQPVEMPNRRASFHIVLP